MKAIARSLPSVPAFRVGAATGAVAGVGAWHPRRGVTRAAAPGLGGARSCQPRLGRPGEAGRCTLAGARSGMGAAGLGARRTAYAVGVLSSSGKGEALAAELGVPGDGVEPVERGLRRLVEGALDRVGADRRAGQQRRARAAGAVVAASDEDWHGLEVCFLNVARGGAAGGAGDAGAEPGAIVNISTAWAFAPAATSSPRSAVFRAGASPPLRTSSGARRRSPLDNVRMHNCRRVDRQLAGDGGAAGLCRCGATGWRMAPAVTRRGVHRRSASCGASDVGGSWREARYPS